MCSFFAKRVSQGMGRCNFNANPNNSNSTGWGAPCRGLLEQQHCRPDTIPECNSVDCAVDLGHLGQKLMLLLMLLLQRQHKSCCRCCTGMPQLLVASLQKHGTQAKTQCSATEHTRSPQCVLWLASLLVCWLQQQRQETPPGK